MEYRKKCYLIMILVFLSQVFFVGKTSADWTTDLTPPVCNNILPNPVSYQYGTANPTFSAKATDNYGINSSSFSVTVTGVSLPAPTIDTTSTSQTQNYSWASAPPINVGSYPLTIDVKDNNGNACSYSSTFDITALPPAACTEVHLKNANGEWGPISGIIPTINQVNWAYSNVLTGTIPGTTCNATVTGCDPDPTNISSCYITPDPSTSDYRARVDFTPTSISACTVTFILNPGSDQCTGTSSTCSPVDGAWGNWSPWGGCFANCGGGGGNQTRTRTCTTPPSCGGANCSGSNIESQSCPNPTPCPPYLKTSGGDVHSNQ